ncbi:MAG: hypothetical protein V3V19_11065 [Cocleimonas sp.]
MSEISKEQALELFKSEFWKTLSAKEIAEFQLFTRRLCMPFVVFHKAIEKALDRPVWMHEFGSNIKGIKKEFLGEIDPPSLQKIIELIPKDKRIIIMKNELDDQVIK